MAPAGARADTPVFPLGESVNYSASIETRWHYVSRTDFSRPVFLFQQQIDRIVARELRTELDFRWALTDNWWLGAKLPISFRAADVEFAALRVSTDQTLPPLWHDLANQGLTDVELSLAHRFLETRRVSAHAHAGTVVNFSDNPGSNTVPRQLPLSTGQSAVFVEASSSVGFGSAALQADYRITYHPGSAASYLVRRVDNQSYASGSLSSYWSHRARLSLLLAASRTLKLKIPIEWTAHQSPGLIDEGQTFAFLPEGVRHELGLEGRLRIQPNSAFALEMFYKHLFLDAYEIDPFFPIAIPDGGFGFAVHLWGS